MKKDGRAQVLKLLNTHWMSRDFAHTTLMLQGMIKWLKWCKDEVALEAEDNEADVTPRLCGQIDLFINTTLNAKKESLPHGRDTKRVRKLQDDHDTLEAMPSPAQFLDAAFKACIWLEVILDWITWSEGSDDWNFVKMATELMVGIIFTSTIAGTAGSQMMKPSPTIAIFHLFAQLHC